MLGWGVLDFWGALMMFVLSVLFVLGVEFCSFKLDSWSEGGDKKCRVYFFLLV